MSASPAFSLGRIDLSPDARRQRRRKITALDFVAWKRIYLGGDPDRDGTAKNWLDRPNTDFHKWSEPVVQDAVRGFVRAVGINHRSGGKSLNVSLAGPLWLACNGWKRFAIIISPVWKEILLAITGELEENRLLQSDWGDRLQPMRDIKRQFVKYTDAMIHLSGNTVIAGTSPDKPLRGLMNRAGMRPDYIVIDDPQKDAERIEADASKAFVSKVEGAIFPMMPLGQRGSLIVVDSFKGEESASMMLFRKHENDKSWRVKLSRAFNPETGELESSITQEELDRIRVDIGPHATAREYGSHALPPAGAVFDLAAASWAPDHDFIREELPGGRVRLSVDIEPDLYLKIFGVAAPVGANGKIRVGVRKVVTAIDPSHGFSDTKTNAHTKNDFFAVVTAAQLDRLTTNRLRVYAIPAASMFRFEAIASDPAFDSKLDYILRCAIQQAVRFGSSHLVTEANGAQKFLAPLIRPILHERKITTLSCLYVAATGQKEARILRLEGPTNSGRVIISKAVAPEFASQLAKFRADGKAVNDDAGDAMEAAIRHATIGAPLDSTGPRAITAVSYTHSRGDDSDDEEGGTVDA